MFQQVYDPVAQSLGLSSFFAALPLLTMFIMLGGFRLSPQLSGLCSLIVAMGVAIIIYGMPVSVAANSALYGAAFSILPIILIIINAIWIHNMMVKSGYFDILRRSFGVISTDLRVQSIIIAFCFGGLLEALAGAGTPIAIAGVMMVAIGMDPLKAALCALVADTAPVAFGALGVPITTLAAVSGLPYDELGAIIGRQTPILAMFIPLILVWIVDGGRGLRQTWLPALVAGFAYAVTQFVSSSWISVPLTDVLGALAGAAALVAFLQVWKPKETVECAIVNEGENSKIPFNSRSVSIAFLPYVAIIVIFTLSQLGPIAQALSAGVSKFAWPGLAIVNPTGGAIGTSLSLPWLPGTATLLGVAGLFSRPFLKVSGGEAVQTYGATLKQLKWAIPTVLCVLAVAFVMNFSGQTITLGRWLATTGHAFAFLSPAIGWIGVAITGSDNSANALFGALQVAAAHETGLSPSLLAAANSSGGVLGKMISPQSLTIGAAAVGIIGREGDIFRKTLPWSIALTLVLCAIVYLQTTPVLSWMLP
ncbi:L-lactate permease [Rhizobium sp. ZW T2_16]|jgi:lactate permease|uniref:L-lactate permease n=1 Tax=Rhizobium sp. ZW T2_16 TaxID=3378083 RepID=UPI0038555207